jgi:isopentenyl-diphosphate Delta-isomerase
MVNTFEEVILVNEKDEPIGVMEKLEAHQKALLHRAFSVLVYNGNGQMLLQKRAFTKYHSPGLWTNTCCSHPRVGETVMQAGHRRLQEEMGFDTELTYHSNFIYKVAFDNGLYEHELDHVLIGNYNELPSFNTDEVCEVAFRDINILQNDILNNPNNYTEWFKIIFKQIHG